MAIIGTRYEIEIFKSGSTGLVELCREVADYAVTNRDNVDLDSAEYDHRDGMHIIRFRRK